MTLVLERGYDQVTVEDITEHAEIGRATFYKYYRDKQALLRQIVDDLQAELGERLEPLDLASTRGFTGKPVLELFRHAQEERAAYRLILRGEGNGIALRAFLEARTASAKRVFAQRAEFLGVQLRIDPDVLARAWVGEQAAVLQWWLEPETPSLTAEEVTQMLLDLSRYGRFWANGFDGEPPPPAAAESESADSARQAP
ncbi:TetR/AcrR family transcriptional regulator [Blastococcus sp. VKM Ac-2987]|uniref:TetR/AcrR family transcriptional regulator n=1 Tax=Blastococcus sp. VKM Ac-2987 TaxID=3004141 RepID=UPI0022ABA56D|nr:TetR/AcrR family transcriptional regulator [Blastococcus sp. VKM Ac-2987]MCZ2857780.1 TetR/AcrR family transcriptional regulator [Blastococcus sp. VKM Ac-2987]